MGATDRLRFDCRIPPRIEQKDVLRRRQVQAQSARFQADQEQPAVRGRLKARDALVAILGPAVEVFVRDAMALKALAHDGKHARELREHERLVALIEHLQQARLQHVEFGRGLPDAPLIEQPGMERRLPKPQQRFEDLYLRPGNAVAFDARKQRPAVMVAQLFVELALLAFEFAVKRLLDLRRQVANHLLLRATQQKGPQYVSQLLACFLVRIARCAVRQAEYRSGSEHARIQELEQAPQLAKMVLYRGTAQGK